MEEKKRENRESEIKEKNSQEEKKGQNKTLQEENVQKIEASADEKDKVQETGGEDLLEYYRQKFEQEGEKPKKKVGYVTIVGKPNVGKSTLINALIGTKVSIVTDKPGTTRIRLLGIRNDEDSQIVFLDTPGIYKEQDAMEKAMIEMATTSLQDADVVLFMIEAHRPWTKQDREIFDKYVRPLKKPVILVINKIDKLKKVDEVLPLIEESAKFYDFAEIVPISAKKGTNVKRLLEVIKKYLPEGEPLFPEDMTVDLPLRLYVAEIVREKILQLTHDEVPQEVAVVINEIKPGDKNPNMLVISGEIIVSRESLKPIIIGKKGQRLKEIGKRAREELQLILGKPIYLQLHVRVKKDWRERPELVRMFGYSL
jgi:GTP-binding protein Era